MVVLPALSRPRTSIRASLLPNKEENILLNKRPIFFLFVSVSHTSKISRCMSRTWSVSQLFVHTKYWSSLSLLKTSKQFPRIQASEVSSVLRAVKMWFQAGQMGLWTSIVSWVSALIRIHAWFFLIIKKEYWLNFLNNKKRLLVQLWCTKTIFVTLPVIRSICELICYLGLLFLFKTILF